MTVTNNAILSQNYS